MNYGVFGLSVFVHVIPSAYGSENYSWATILEGQPPSILEQWNLFEIHFEIIFIFKPKF